VFFDLVDEIDRLFDHRTSGFHLFDQVQDSTPLFERFGIGCWSGFDRGRSRMLRWIIRIEKGRKRVESFELGMDQEVLSGSSFVCLSLCVLLVDGEGLATNGTRKKGRNVDL